MKTAKPYSSEESQPTVVSEPTIAYINNTLDPLPELNQLKSDITQSMSEIANGDTVSNAQMQDVFKRYRI